MNSEEKAKYIDIFLKGLNESSFPNSLAGIIEMKQFPSKENRDNFKLLEYELEKHGLVQLIRGRDNSTLNGQCEYLISGKGLEYVLNDKSTIELFQNNDKIDTGLNLGKRIVNLTIRAERYKQIREEKDLIHSEVNLYRNIELYTNWFLESRELFSEFFDESTLEFKEFCEFDTKGNGFVLASKFSTTYSLFGILIKKIGDVKTHKTNTTSMKNKIFIVHGHNSELKLEVARFIESDFNKEAVILHERPNKGREILGKFEDEADVDVAIAIWSKDDVGKVNSEEFALKPRARQNVIFETGYFIGKLGREKVIVLLEDGIEAPSDYSGLMYISTSDWKYKLGKELNEIYKE